MKGALVVLFAVLLAACGQSRDLPNPAIDCRTGVYVNAAGDAWVLTPTSQGYRWRMPNGATGALGVDGGASTLGWTGEPDGYLAELGACGDDVIRFGSDEAMERFERVPLRITDTTFEHDGLLFSGHLVWPADAERAPLVVHLHGSERWSAVRSNSMQYLLAAQGIASFVFDKRGTGQSEGQYTQDFHVLAGDARAALAEARRLAGNAVETVGFLGGSQGGWIGPLAASNADVDFVVALYGMAEGPLAEDRAEVIQSVAHAGWGEAEQARAGELADAAGVIMASDFREGFDDFDRLRRAYRDEPWYDDVKGEFTGDFLPHPSIGLRIVGPFRDLGTSWEYDPMPVLRGLEVRQFWMIAADDTEAPSAETVRRLRALQAESRPIDLAVYPNADHGMVAVERGDDGAVRETGYVQDYHRQVAAWIKSGDLSFARAAGADVSAAAAEAP